MGSARGEVEAHGVEAVDSGRMQAQTLDLGAGHRPVEAHVDGQPREVLGDKSLGSLVEPLTLGAERELAASDQHVVESRVAIEGEVQRAWTLGRSLAGREREQEQMRGTSGDRGL